jgi:hypothetical protein
MFTLADTAEGKTKTENALIIKEKLEALKESIPVIRKMNVFVNGDNAPAGNHDIVLDSEFDTMDDVKAYAVHPEHVKVAEFIGKVRTGRAAIDYEF